MAEEGEQQSPRPAFEQLATLQLGEPAPFDAESQWQRQ